jgi:hypothetical protein
MKRQGLQRPKMTKQKAKLMCKRAGGELDDIMYGSMVEKMTKGGSAKRNVYSAETGRESMQEYNLGGGTHNTYSGKRKKKK